MIRQAFFITLTLSIIIVSWGCSDSGTNSGGGGSNPDTTFAADIQPIFTARCATSGCHDLSNSTGTGLILVSGHAYDSLVGVASVEVALNRVEPGDADNSYLVHKIEGTQTVGDRMPRNQTPLTPDQIQMIRAWIDQGALDN